MFFICFLGWGLELGLGLTILSAAYAQEEAWDEQNTHPRAKALHLPISRAWAWAWKETHHLKAPNLMGM